MRTSSASERRPGGEQPRDELPRGDDRLVARRAQHPLPGGLELGLAVGVELLCERAVVPGAAVDLEDEALRRASGGRACRAFAVTRSGSLTTGCSKPARRMRSSTTSS